jgi:hypothetical protein
MWCLKGYVLAKSLSYALIINERENTDRVQKRNDISGNRASNQNRTFFFLDVDFDPILIDFVRIFSLFECNKFRIFKWILLKKWSD